MIRELRIMHGKAPRDMLTAIVGVHATIGVAAKVKVWKWCMACSDLCGSFYLTYSPVTATELKNVQWWAKTAMYSNFQSGECTHDAGLGHVRPEGRTEEKNASQQLLCPHTHRDTVGLDRLGADATEEIVGGNVTSTPIEERHSRRAC